MGEIDRNVTSSEEYSEESFLGILHESCRWSDAEYEKLEKAIFVQAEQLGSSSDIPGELASRIVCIFNHIMLLIGCHYDNNDGFIIEGLTDEGIDQRRERLQHIFEGFFTGRMPAKDHKNT